MRDHALITKISKEEILVTPLITDACISCTKTSCNKQGKPFPVSNPYEILINQGDIVKISASSKSQTLQGLFSIAFPTALAIVGFFVANNITEKLNIATAEWIKATGVLIGLSVAVAIVLLINRFVVSTSKSYISANLTQKS